MRVLTCARRRGEAFRFRKVEDAAAFAPEAEGGRERGDTRRGTKVGDDKPCKILLLFMIKTISLLFHE